MRINAHLKRAPTATAKARRSAPVLFAIVFGLCERARGSQDDSGGGNGAAQGEPAGGKRLFAHRLCRVRRASQPVSRRRCLTLFPRTLSRALKERAAELKLL